MGERSQKLYVFSKIESGYYSAHSLIREVFNAPNNQCAAMVRGDLIWVSSALPPKNIQSLTTLEVTKASSTDEVITLEAHVAFDNRHRDNKVPKYLTPGEALMRFAESVGLESTTRSKSQFLGPHKEDKFNIHNTFRFFGEFKISNLERLNQGILKGVGSRRSYGFGLILIEGA